ncbi:MAG: sigma 54-interacting transcriptional regulator [Proteobacteria bacterium]|nr:sigma 54-interacting transcriptional regulator [Pseudomonadota bacterium]
MQIKITTQNITGLSKEILSLLATYDLDIQKIEVESGLMFLATQEIEKHLEREIASKLTQIQGVKWVEGIALMPINERNLFLNEILNAVADPVFGINNKGKIIYQNMQAQSSFKLENNNILFVKDIFTQKNWATSIDVAATNTLPVNISTVAGNMLVTVRSIKQQNNTIGAVLIFHKHDNIATRSHIIQAAQIQGFDSLIFENHSMQDIANRAKHMSNTLVPLVISGETGVGKTTIAQALHYYSNRKNKLFSSMNCSVTKQAQISSDLFGLANPQHGKAGLLEISDGGTIYIQAIQDMPDDCQKKLLAFIQTNEFTRVGGKITRQATVKIIVSCTKLLQHYVENLQFNSELYYALDITRLAIPALRERPADIESLIMYFLKEFEVKTGQKYDELSFNALNKIKSYYWPGNITQLKDVLYKASLITETNIIAAEHIEIDGHVHIESNLDNRTLPQAVAEFEKHFLQHWYQKYSSTRKLAQQLGVSHTTIAQKLNKYNIS